MARNNIIDVQLFGEEIGRIGYDEHRHTTSFQFNPVFLASNKLLNAFPKTGVLRRTPVPQIFHRFNGETFKGLAPPFADSLPDHFGSIIFKTWLSQQEQKEINILEQLAYVGARGMGALEYHPRKKLPKNTSIELNEMIAVLREVLDLKKSSEQGKMNSKALLNIFKIGSSAGGARPKIIISEHKETRKIIPGDLEVSADYNHYLIKLAIEEENNYPREVIEYCYYQMLQKIGIRIMDSKLIEHKHFATLRFDRQNGEKQHTLTASGLTGWDYKDTTDSSYENLFKLCSFLKVPHAQIEELFKRMVFNISYGNTDDHLKNHSFIYNKEKERWNLSPAYDVTYATNPLLPIKARQALSINGKRNKFVLADILKIANEFTVKNPTGVIKLVQAQKTYLVKILKQHDIPTKISAGILENTTALI